MRLQRDVGWGPLAVDATAGGIEVLDGIAAEWSSLCDEGPCDQPFYRPEWIRAHLEAFEPRARIRLVQVRRGGRLRAVLPLVEEWGTLRGIPIRRLRGAAGVHSCRFDLVHGADEGEEAADAVWSFLSREGGWEVLELPDVPAGGALEHLLERARLSGFPVGTWESMRTPWIPLDGDFETVVGRTDAKFRANVRRRFRKLQSKGQVGFERIERADPAVLQKFYDLERAGWKGNRGTAIACDPATRKFYDTVARWAESEKCLSLYSLSLDGKPVAMHFGLTWRGRYWLPKPAFDENHRECSPGQLLLQEVLRDCIDRKLVEFDFLGPWMEWKADWTEKVRPHNWLYVFRKGPLGHLLHTAKFRLHDIHGALWGR